MVCNVPPIEDVWEKFRFFINHAILVNHQVSMDMSILKTTAECLKLAPITNQVLCTLKLARRVFPKENSYGLPHLREILGIASNEKHRALKDAEDTTLLFKHMVEILEDRYKISGYQQLYDFCYSENPWQSQMF
jgi:DNA polymerase-3 subunit epsilon